MLVELFWLLVTDEDDEGVGVAGEGAFVEVSPVLESVAAAFCVSIVVDICEGYKIILSLMMKYINFL